MSAQELAEAVLYLELGAVLFGACGGVLVASLIRWVAEYIHEAQERALRIVQARMRDHKAVPAIK